MGDERTYRRRSTDSVDAMLRITKLEQQHLALVQRIDAHIAESALAHRDALALIQKLDERADKMDQLWARALALGGFGLFAGQILAPYVLHALGAPAQ